MWKLWGWKPFCESYEAHGHLYKLLWNETKCYTELSATMWVTSRIRVRHLLSSYTYMFKGCNAILIRALCHSNKGFMPYVQGLYATMFKGSMPYVQGLYAIMFKSLMLMCSRVLSHYVSRLGLRPFWNDNRNRLTAWSLYLSMRC